MTGLPVFTFCLVLPTLLISAIIGLLFGVLVMPYGLYLTALEVWQAIYGCNDCDSFSDSFGLG